MAYTVEQSIRFLLAAHERERLPHALLLTDPALTGAHSVAAQLVAHMNKIPLKDLDAMESDYCRIVRAHSKSRKILVDDIRNVEPFFQKKALGDKWKIGVFPEADCLNEQAANAFLKTLEEPPPRSLIILITAHPEQLMRTILSRCVRMDIYTPGMTYVLSSVEKALVPAWIEACNHLGSELSALAFRGAMSHVLTQAKESIRKRHESALKETSKGIALATGVKDWEKQMEDVNNAVIEAEYLNERDNLLDFFIAWFGDALRLKSRAPHIQLSEYEDELKSLSSTKSVPELMRRIAAIENLRDDLKTNVHEQLALDVRLLEALA